MSFAPEIVEAIPEYSTEAYVDYDTSSADSGFWSRARTRLILWVLQKHFPTARSFLEIGCGAGAVLEAVARTNTDWRTVGCEALRHGLERARNRLPQVELLQADARRLPFHEEFDVAGAFDVLEHIEDDEAAMRSIAAVIRPAGGLIITVPQHPWMWSPADDYAHHARRYTRRDLVAKAHRAGLVVERVTSFVSLLLPVMAASRILRRWSRRQYRLQDEVVIGQVWNSLFGSVMMVERMLIRFGIPLPVGGSLLLVARKPHKPSDCTAGRAK